MLQSFMARRRRHPNDPSRQFVDCLHKIAVQRPPFALDPAFRARQLHGVKSERFAGLAHHARVEIVVCASQRNLCISAFAMHRHRDMAFVSSRMLIAVDAAPVLDQPLPECCAFHCSIPFDNKAVSGRSEPLDFKLLT
jgi:hypothetical protein